MKTIRRFLSLAAPFWWRNNPWFNWLLLAAVVGFSLAIVRVGVLITDWNKTFYDALAAFDGRAMPVLVTEFLVYIALVTGFIACGNWLRKVLLFRWREHLTRQFQQNWLGGHKHYRLQLTGEPDNPDQRIAEDVAMLSEKSIDLFKYFIMNAAKLGAFVEILWQLSGVQTFTLFGQSITVKGYLVWIALAYSAACTLLTHLIGRKLQPLNVERQHREADYRATLLRVRESAEQIAFYRGETAEEGRLNSRFAAVKSNWRGLIRREFYLESFSAAYLRLSMFIPIIATLPMYLAHSMSFGDMMKARSAFSNVQDGFGWFMDYYKRIIEWAAVVERLAGFQTALDEADKAARSSENLTDTPVGRILESDKISTAQETPDVGWVSTHQLGTNGGSRPTLLAENLSIHTAEGSPLLHNLTLAAASRQWQRHRQNHTHAHARRIVALSSRPFPSEQQTRAVPAATPLPAARHAGQTRLLPRIRAAKRQRHPRRAGTSRLRPSEQPPAQRRSMAQNPLRRRTAARQPRPRPDCPPRNPVSRRSHQPARRRFRHRAFIPAQTRTARHPGHRHQPPAAGQSSVRPPRRLGRVCRAKLNARHPFRWREYAEAV